MVLKNSIGEIIVEKIDNITQENFFEYIHDPLNFSAEEFYDILSLEIKTANRDINIALFCDLCGNLEKCTVLNNDSLVIAKFNTVYMINIMTCELHLKELGSVGGAYSLHQSKNGYIIHCETEIIMLDFNFNELWSFCGADIFTSVTGKECFKLFDNRIELYDFADNYYEIDLNGKLIKSSI